jgi:hypothetical protein
MGQESNIGAVKDTNFRNALIDLGFIKEGRFQTRKIELCKRLNLSNRNIITLDGIDVFKKIYELNLSNNRIENIDLIPDCVSRLDISNNKFTSLHKDDLPNSLYFLNYSGNAIENENLGPPFKRLSCDEKYENCLPNELRVWRSIVNGPIGDRIEKVLVEINYSYSWGQGKQKDEITFKRKGSKLRSKRINTTRTKSRLKLKEGEEQVTYSKERFKYSLYESDLRKLIPDMLVPSLIYSYEINGTMDSIDFRNKRSHSLNFLPDCMDCTRHKISLSLISKKDTVRIGFSSYNMSPGVSSYTKVEPIDVQSVLNWVYMYKVMNLVLPEYGITKNAFNEKNFKHVIDWDK